jgi:hypothetical protein
LKGVDVFGVIETWTSEKDEIELDGYRCVPRIRKKNDQVGRCSSGVGIFYKEKLYHRVQLLNNVGLNVLWIIMKADKGKEERICVGVCYNPLRGSKYENPRFFEELESEVLEIKSTVVESDIIVMEDLNVRCGDLIPSGLMEEEEENGWYKNNLFAVSSRRSEDKVVNEEGRKLISFCEILNLEILNGSREGFVEGKMTFISKTDASVIEYILCSYDIGRCLKTFRVRDMAISDHNIIETVTEVEDRNRADKMNEYYSKQLKMYKWYEEERRDFEQRRDGKSTEIFMLGVEYFLCR